MTEIADRMRPRGPRVVLRFIEQEEQTKSGLFIPEGAKEKPYRGTILAVGPGRRLESGELVPIDLAVGDVVLFQKYAGTQFKLDLDSGEELLIIGEADVLAVLIEAGA